MVTPLLAPAAPRRRWRLGWLLSGAAATGLVWAGLCVAGDQRFHVHHVVVEHVDAGDATVGGGAATKVHASPVEVRHLANVRRDQPLWRVDLAGVVRGVLLHPWIAEVEATRRWPDTVVIRVVEHQPALLLQLDGLYYVEADGEVFSRARGSDLDYPVLTGLDQNFAEVNPAVARRVVRDALALLETVDASGEVSRADLSEIHFDLQDGFTLVLRGGVELALGFSDAADRLPRLAQLRAHGVDPAEPRRIDLASESIALVRSLPSPAPPSASRPTGLD